MGFIGGHFGYWLLRTIAPPSEYRNKNISCQPETKLLDYFGEDFFQVIKDKIVIDFGCGSGRESVEMAKNGAKKVIGIDIQPRLLAAAMELAVKEGVEDKCVFCTGTSELADVVISKDAFEHFNDPSETLLIIERLLKKNGFALAAFGPTWFHPYGGHLFSVFPWAHFIFTEKVFMKWRSEFKNDGAKCFSEVEGGLNRISIKIFEKMVELSPFKFERLETSPIKGISLFKAKPFRELGSSIVKCKLIFKK